MSEIEDCREISVELDVGNLCIDKVEYLKSPIAHNFNENKLKELASLGVQKLLNKIFSLPSEYHENIPVAKLPEPTTNLPREKPVPKDKPPTKWEKFAKDKGIKKRKKDKLVWDETSKEWKPQYGYRSANNQSKDWLIEVPDNADPNVDYFAKKQDEKKEKVAKNEYQRLRNIASAQKMKVTNLESVDKANKDQLSRSVAAAKSATASIGKFTEKLPKEKAPKNSMIKRKFKCNLSTKGEKENNLKILEEINHKKPKLDVAEAVQKYMTKPLKQKSEEKSATAAKKKRAKKNKFVKNQYRSGPKKGGFKKPVK